MLNQPAVGRIIQWANLNSLVPFAVELQLLA